MLLRSLLFTGLAAAQPCFLAANPYPVPTALCEHHVFREAASSVEEQLGTLIQTSPYNLTSFSASIFTASDPGLAWEYHHTTALIQNSTVGTQKVDSDSVYRIGSISKALTVYLWLLTVGDKHWEDSITEYIPELRGGNGSSSEGLTPRWEDITIGDLAGQIAGLHRDYGLADLAVPNGLLPPVEGLPDVSPDRIPTCNYLTTDGGWVGCSESEYLAGVAAETPIFPSGYTPVYSNQAYAILGTANSRAESSSVESLFDRHIIEALGLNGTSYTVPRNGSDLVERGVIPVDPEAADWDIDLGPFTPAGGHFSTTNDLATIGRAILNHKQLPQPVIRRWLKPTSFAEEFSQGVGRPWEIFRVKVGGHSVQLYTKGGDWGSYSTVWGLLPQYDLGFSVLTAFDDASVGGAVRALLSNRIADEILPTVDEVAKQQARERFGGRFVADNVNSSITISTDESAGLRLTEWITNGTDLTETLSGLIGGALDFRLLPNQLYEGNRVGFTGLYQNTTNPNLDSGTLYWPCATWLGVDQLTYGNVPLGHFVFEVDEAGRAESVRISSLAVTLRREA